VSRQSIHSWGSEVTTRKASFTAEFLEQQKERLLQMKEAFLNPGNTGTDASAAASNEGMHDFNRLRLGDIERALQKIDEGTYGLSDESGEPIPQARLEAFPDALYTEREQEEREVGK
jgi:RNA polymerase-binding transcription factor DksA